MAEPTTPRRPGVKLAERDGLLATKLHVPGRVPSSGPAPACSSA
jgi:hypothetical protein